MVFSTACSSFKGFKYVIQKLKDPKNSWKFVRPKKTRKFCETQKNRIWPNFKPKKIGRASPLKFRHVPPWGYSQPKASAEESSLP